MKKLLAALILSMLVLSGCGLFRDNHAWKQAKQENPLQVPPTLDRPSTTAALSIPPPANTQTAPTSAPSSASAVNATRMQLSDDVDTAYERVGLALQHGDLGTVVAQDLASHTYRLSISTRPELGTSQSFLQKHFSNLNQPRADTSSDDAADSGPDAGNGAVTVTLRVAPATNGGGSIVSASGDPQQAVHVISVLSGRLGG